MITIRDRQKIIEGNQGGQGLLIEMIDILVKELNVLDAATGVIKKINVGLE